MTKKSVVKIGNAQGFWGDTPLAPARLVQQVADLDYLTLDYLSEVSLSIMAIQKEKDPNAGYALDFKDVISSLIPAWKAGAKVKVIANAGGLNPRGCALACQEMIRQSGLDKKIGFVEGDDVLSYLKSNMTLPLFNNLETKKSLQTIEMHLATANAYLGADSIVRALELGADIVITGRVADPSLTVAPCMYHYGWSKDDYQKIAGATVAGHLIECGTQATGGISTHWLSIAEKIDIGFPIVEVLEDGSCILAKPLKSGGEVSIRTTKEQLLYEINDPENYLSPDATVSFLGLKLESVGENRVRVSGAIGSCPPETYKVSATYRDGFRADAFLALIGPDVVEKGLVCSKIILERVRQAGFELEHFRYDCIGNGAIVPGVSVSSFPLAESILRFAAADSRIEAVKSFTKEIAPLVTAGPQGITGYISGRPKVRPIFGYWPCLIHKNFKINVCLLEP